MKCLKAKLSLKVSIPSSQLPPLCPPKPNHPPQIDCTHIIDNIYISNYKTSTDYNFLKQNKFSYIINCAGGSSTFTPVLFEEFSYLTINLRDHCESNIEEGVLQIEKFIDTLPEGGNKILFHCSEGISRAPALVVAYLIRKKKMKYEKALSLVKEKRSIVDINIGFLIQLRNMELGCCNSHYIFKPLYNLV